MRTGAQELLDYWFGPRPLDAESVRRHRALWFGDPSAPELTPQNDEQLRQRFSGLTDSALSGQLSSWESSPRRRLALILLLDQLPRSLFRGNARAFAGDRAALTLAVAGMQFGMDATLEAPERWFFYMPLQHSESREVQEESVAAFRRLAAEAPAALAAGLRDACRFAERHRDIVQRFGRFPHRNAALGRASTPEEREWLAGGGEHFGQP